MLKSQDGVGVGMPLSRALGGEAGEQVCGRATVCVELCCAWWARAAALLSLLPSLSWALTLRAAEGWGDGAYRHQELAG